MDKLNAELLKNLCQVRSCGLELDQYELLCPRHWLLVPIYLRGLYRGTFLRLELDQTLDRSTAWKESALRMGMMDASERLADYHEVLKKIESALEVAIREEICQRIRNEKWDGENFKPVQA